MTVVSYLRDLCMSMKWKSETSCDEVVDMLAWRALAEFKDAEIAKLCIKSVGNCFEGGLKVTDSNCVVHEYDNHFVLVSEGKVFDPIHGYHGVDINRYFKAAIMSKTPWFRFDKLMSLDLQYATSKFDDEVKEHYVDKL